jgi:scyllo-inositol 2-dehydrogenase (NAD+)
VRAAVIGCGRIGGEPSLRLSGQLPPGWLPVSHIEAVLEIKDFTKIALCDSNPDVLAKRGTQYGITNLYTDHRELLADFKPDILTIATRTPQKAAIIEALADSSVRGVYIEKPFANSIARCEHLLARLAKSKLVIGYGVTRRYHAMYRTAQRFLSDGDIGQLTSITIETPGPSQLMWTHPHSMDLILFFAGSSACCSVNAELNRETLPALQDLTIDSDPCLESASFDFQNGVSASIRRGPSSNVDIVGTTGRIRVEANGASVVVSPSKGSGKTHGQLHILAQEAESATVTAIREMTRALSGDRQPLISPQAIQTGITMLMACVWSQLEGGRIQITDVPRDLVVTGRFGDVYA